MATVLETETSGSTDRLGSPLARHLARIHDRHRGDPSGQVATYIPELGRADPNWFGVAAATLDGVVHEVGDTRVPFTIQSISKPLTYGLILDDLGESVVRARIGVEPTGDAFNAITLAPATGMPLNPMVNAGAIAAASLVRAGDAADPMTRLLATYGAAVGRPLQIDQAVLASERATGHRNVAIGHLLRASGAIDGDVEGAVERYFAQCSVAITAADLALAAATLANGGVNPRTGERAFSAATVRSVLAVMSTCGMYDGAGEWLYTVGLPAKSGVSGGILVVVPGRMGLGLFSPPLDDRGNSVRGIRACHDIVHDLGLHPLGGRTPRGGIVRAAYSLAEVGSKRTRTAADRARLAAEGARVLAVELQGDVTFLTADALADAVRPHDRGVGASLPVELVIVDVRRVTGVEESAIALLADLIAQLRARGIDVTLAGRHGHPAAIAGIERALAAVRGGPLSVVDDLDTALEWAEDRILADDDDERSTPAEVSLAEQDAVAGLDPAAIAIVERFVDRRSYAPGSPVVRAGDPSTDLFLVASGRLSVGIGIDGAAWRRLSTLGPGMAFGETSLLGGGRRGADVVADAPTVCFAMTTRDFERLAAEHPTVASAILRNLLRTASATAGRLTAELAVLAG